MLHYEDSGLPNVWLANGFEKVDTAYGEAVVIHDVPGLTRAICMALIRKQAKLSGVAFRYIRQAMLLSQSSLGKSLGRTDQAVAGWEKTGKIPRYADIMLRVLYAAHVDGNEKVRNIVQALNEVDRVINFVMTDSPGGWLAAETASLPVDGKTGRKVRH